MRIAECGLKNSEAGPGDSPSSFFTPHSALRTPHWEGVVVLGAGLAGLGCARALPGCRVFEAKEHVGGHAYSHPLDGVAFDEGAHICHSKDEAFLRLIRAAAGRVVESPSVVRNSWRGAWLSYPVQNHLHQLPLLLRVAALTDLVLAQTQAGADPADYLAWCRRQYGTCLTDTFYRPFTHKYWRVGLEELATDWLAGRLLPAQLPRIVAGTFGPQLEDGPVFARFHYPARGGFFAFFAPLYDGLAIHTNERAVEIDLRRRTVAFASGRREPYDFLASSIPLPQLVAICKDVPAALREQAARLRHTQMVCVNLIVDVPALTDCHWFYVYDEDVAAARVSLPSNLAPGCAPPGTTALQGEVFRRQDEACDVAAIEEDTVADLARLLHFDARDVRLAEARHVRHAYVISDHARAGAVEHCLGWLEERNVYSMGLYGRWRYVWSDAAFRQGEETATAIRRRTC
jgi:protoporphyrinogen oxidase